MGVPVGVLGSLLESWGPCWGPGGSVVVLGSSLVSWWPFWCFGGPVGVLLALLGTRGLLLGSRGLFFCLWRYVGVLGALFVSW